MKIKPQILWKKLFVLLLSVSMLCAQPLGAVMAEGPQPEIVDGFSVSEVASEEPALETPGGPPVDVPAEPFGGTAEEGVEEQVPPIEHDSEAKARNVYRFNRTFDGIPEDNVIYEQTVVDGDIIQSFEIASQLNGYIFRAIQYSDGRPFHFDDPVAVDQQSDGAVIDVLLCYESPVQNYQVYLSKDGTIADVPLYEQELRNGSTLELPSQILPAIEGYSLQGLTYEDGSPFDPDAAIKISPEEDGHNKIILAQYVADKVEEEAVALMGFGEPLGSGDGAYYAVWNVDTKTITFTAKKPSEESDPCKNPRDIIDKHKDSVINIEFNTPVKLAPDQGKNLFDGCINLVSIENLPKLDTSAVTDMRRMFFRCSSLKGLDLSGFNTANVRNMNRMFGFCSSLTTLDVSKFNTASVYDMYCMFGECKKLLSLDVSAFDVSGIGTSYDGYPGMSGIFYGCSAMESLNMSSFACPFGYDLQNAFAGCLSLKRLVLGPKLSRYGRPDYKAALEGVWTKEGTDISYTAEELTSQYDPQTMAGVWLRTDDNPEGHYYRSDGSLDKNNMWEVHSPEDRFTGFCMNLNRFGVGSYLDRKTVTNDGDIEALLQGDASVPISSGSEPLGSNLREALITLAYFGYPNDQTLIEERYNLSDAQFLDITQNAIWDFLNRYNAKAGPGLYANQPNMLAAYKELLSHRFDEIPNASEYRLHIYESRNSYQQNLFSVEGLDDQIYGGVEVKKVDDNGRPLQGAVFTVYDASGKPVGTMVSREDGKASICRTDHSKGLPSGTYTVKETQAPAGYNLVDDTFTFSIVEANVIVSWGIRQGMESDGNQDLLFTDEQDETYEGAGIRIKKISQDKGRGLENAEFTIYNEKGEAVQKIYTDGLGMAQTGIRDLPLGTYTIKETRAPVGYFLDPEEREITLTQKDTYYEDWLTFTNKSKSGQIILKATKSLEGAPLEDNQFTFQLMDMHGAVLQSKKNSADGAIEFDPILYDADDIGFKQYKLVEIIGNDEKMNYDRHVEIVTVTIRDSGQETLNCTVAYDEDGVQFINKANDKKFPIKVQKFIHNSLNLIEGAELVIKDMAGREICKWKTSNAPEEILLYPGTYVLHELKAPDGYYKTPDVTFTVDEEGKLSSNVWDSCHEDVLSISDSAMLSTVEFYLRKVEKLDGNKDFFLEGAEFSLTGKTVEGKEIVGKAVSDKSGLVRFYGLDAGTYTLTETKAPAGYAIPSTSWTVNVENKVAVIHSSNIDDSGTMLQTTYSPTAETQTQTLEGTSGMHVRLLYQTEDNYDFITLYGPDDNLLKADKNGRAIGKDGAITGGLDAGIINTEDFDFDFNQLTIKLRPDENRGGYGYYGILSHQNVVITDSNGNEVNLSEDHTYQIQNYSKLTNIAGAKTWDDSNNQEGMRPERITIRLLKNGKEIDSKTVTEADGWAWNFENLPQYEAGELITYTITEDAVENYSAEVSGYNVTNTHTPGKTSVQVTKEWIDDNNKSGQRPTQVTVRLFANGVDTGKTLVLSENNHWAGTFTALDIYQDGKKVDYTVEEMPVERYQSMVSGDASSGFVVINSLKPGYELKKQLVTLPRTGEKRSPYSWIGMLLFSAGLIFIIVKRKLSI